VEKVPQLPSKAPFSKRFEEAVGQACESASVRQVTRQFRLAASTVRAIDLVSRTFLHLLALSFFSGTQLHSLRRVVLFGSVKLCFDDHGSFVVIFRSASENVVASIAALHGCGGVFIQRSKSKRVAGIHPSA
jgi:hypothetical protein